MLLETSQLPQGLGEALGCTIGLDLLALVTEPLKDIWLLQGEVTNVERMRLF